MPNESVLNVRVPDKLYFAMKKAAQQKNISIAALSRMICSDWIMEQSQDIKGVFTYPESKLAGLSEDERNEYIDVIAFGGVTYNIYGEACFDDEDDCIDDDVYASLVTPEEIKESQKRMLESRRKLNRDS